LAVAKKRKAIRLSKMAFELVEENAGEITQCLMKSTREGKVMSTKLLVELAEGNVDVEVALTKGPLRSLALRLEAEPQMPPHPQDAAVETAVGSLAFDRA
jgi:hypothetical protein